MQTCLFAVCARRDAESAADALRKMGFIKAPETDVNPAEETKRLRESLDKLKARNDALGDKIRGFADRRGEIEFLVDYFTMRITGKNLLQRGVEAPALKRDKLWKFEADRKKGEHVIGGDILGHVQETHIVTQRIMPS